ncbi:hypothetical protein ABW19_dt0207135 [Dactylella cylindrospora]|nr:hypothetical protein ABW19_dt0207135 [Dactylella cylindrospora]
MYAPGHHKHKSCTDAMICALFLYLSFQSPISVVCVSLSRSQAYGVSHSLFCNILEITRSEVSGNISNVPVTKRIDVSFFGLAPPTGQFHSHQVFQFSPSKRKKKKVRARTRKKERKTPCWNPSIHPSHQLFWLFPSVGASDPSQEWPS